MRIVQNSNNIIRVLKAIKVKPGISRIEISKQIGLDKSTVTVVANRLMELGFIEETTESLTPYQGGRRPIGIRLKENTGLILGLEIQTDYYIAVLMDLTGKVHRTTQGKVEGTKNFFYTFLDIYKEVYKEIEELKLPLLGVGIGTSGMINTHKGIISDSNPMGIHSPENFYEEIRAFLQMPVFIDNDANCGCWAELSDMNSERPQDFLYVLGEFRRARIAQKEEGDDSHVIGVGMGVVIGERVHYGHSYGAGEYQSTQWKAPNKTQFSITDAQVKACKSDQEIFDLIKKELARDIAFIVNIIDLCQVTLGGGLAEFKDQLEPLIQEAILYNWSYENRAPVAVTASNMRKETVAFGAASMLLEHLFLTYETPSENPWSQKVGIELFNSIAEQIQS